MMKRTQLALFVLLAAVLPSGCGTVCNLASDDPKVYGGCDHDPLLAIKLKPTATSTDKGALGRFIFFAAFYPTVICLDLAGDTLMLPVTLLLAERDQPAESKPAQTTVLSPRDQSSVYSAGAVVEDHPLPTKQGEVRSTEVK